MTQEQKKQIEDYIKSIIVFSETDFNFEKGKCKVQLDDEDATIQEMEGVIVSDDCFTFGIAVGELFYEGVEMLTEDDGLLLIMQGEPVKISDLI